MCFTKDELLWTVYYNGSFSKTLRIAGGSISIGLNTYRPNFEKRENTNSRQYLQLRVMKGIFPSIEMRDWMEQKIHCIELYGLKGLIAFMPLVYPCQLMPIIGSGRCINERMSLGPMSLDFSWKGQADIFGGVAMLGWKNCTIMYGCKATRRWKWFADLCNILLRNTATWHSCTIKTL